MILVFQLLIVAFNKYLVSYNIASILITINKTKCTV